MHIIKDVENFIPLQNYKSLFEFLGRRAGPDLGLKVWKEAINGNVPIGSSIVSNSNIRLVVKTYPIDFLVDYFETNPQDLKMVKGDSPVRGTDYFDGESGSIGPRGLPGEKGFTGDEGDKPQTENTPLKECVVIIFK